MGVKYIASPLIFTLLMYKSGLQPDGSCAVNIDSGSRPQFDAITYMTINTTYLLAILCNPEDDFQCMLVPVLTLGRYSKLPFNNYVFLSSSLREFWGGRYNLLVSSLLRQAVFTPAKKKGYSNSISSLMAFAASGALHMLVAHYTFGYGMIRTMGFFLLQPLIISLEMYIESRYPWLKAKCPPFARCILTMSVFCLTCPLYVGLFTEAMPEFLVNCNRDVKLPTWAVVCSDWIGKAVFGMAVHPLILAGVDAPLKAKTE
uniref:Wax synthase domain-containing protein n=1 Tax=Amorphochlora amoebiformis TaxID=1561963 RepID=A0A7S0H406_9EUKA